jgi:hypothetical protein
LPDAFGAPLSGHPAIARWTEQMEGRPGWQAVSPLCQDLMRQDVKSIRAAAPEALDRFLGRQAGP